MSEPLPFNIAKDAFKSPLGVSSYRATFEAFLAPVQKATHLNDEEWLLALSNFLSQFFAFENTCLREHNHYLLTNLVKHGFIQLPKENGDV